MEGSGIWAIDTDDLFSFWHSAHTPRLPYWHVRQQLTTSSCSCDYLPCCPSKHLLQQTMPFLLLGRLWSAISRQSCWLALSLLSPEFPEHSVLFFSFLFFNGLITFCSVQIYLWNIVNHYAGHSKPGALPFSWSEFCGGWGTFIMNTSLPLRWAQGATIQHKPRMGFRGEVSQVSGHE